MTATALTTVLEQAHGTVSDRLRGAAPVLWDSSREELVMLISAAQQLINTVTAVQQQALAHLSAIDDVRDQDGAWTVQHRGLGHTDIGAPGDAAGVMGLSEAAAGNRIADAIHQITITPDIHAAVAAGELDQWRAHVITTELAACPDDVAAAVAGQVIAYYHSRGGWVDSAGPLRSRVRRLIVKHAPETVAEQAAEAVNHRHVRRWAATVGTDHWEAEIPVETSLPMWHAINTLATKLRTHDAGLSADQARADALTQLVLQQADITLHLHATTPEPTTSTPETPEAAPSSADLPACANSGRVIELGGLNTQPVIVDLDALSAHVTLKKSTPLYCHPGTGAITSGHVPKSLGNRGTRDTTKQKPGSDTSPPAGASSLAGDARDNARTSDSYVVPADLARLIRLRDGHCRFPGCIINATYCDLDHVTPWPAGPTNPTNLMTLCRRHHRVKQKPSWHVRLNPDATATWTTPTRQTRTTTPTNHLHATLPKTVTPTTVASATPQAAGTTSSFGDHLEDNLQELTFTRVLELHGIHQPTRPQAHPEPDTHHLTIPINPKLLRCSRIRSKPTEYGPPPF